MGEQHARAFAGDARCRLRWVFDLEAPRMQRVVQAIGQGAAADSYEQVLADPAVDIVALATYDNLHAAAVVSALQAGKHVFCEKPLCETAESFGPSSRPGGGPAAGWRATLCCGRRPSTAG